MTPDPDDIAAVQPYLSPGEQVLWLGPERLPRAATPAVLAIGFVAVAAVFWYFWFADPSFADSCKAEASKKCATFSILVPLGVAVMWVSQAVQMTQHLLMHRGRARRLNILTDRRFLRFATWPWTSLRGTDLSGRKARKRHPGRLYFSRRDFYFLHPDELDLVLDLIAKRQSGDMT